MTRKHTVKKVPLRNATQKSTNTARERERERERQTR